MQSNSPILPVATPGLTQLAALAAAQPIMPSCTQFVFLRHGQTARNVSRIFQGPDEPLNATGLAQAQVAAGLLASEPLASVVCSSMLRACQTAAAVAAPHGLAPLVQDDLRERNFGEFIGTSSVDIDWACAPARGETLAQFIERTRRGLLFALGQTAPVLVVAHGGTLYVLAGLLGIPLTTGLVGNAQALRFERQAGVWQVVPLAAGSGAASNIA